MGRQNKLGNLRGVSEWEALENVGHVKRFIRWTILSVRDQSLDARTAGTFALLSGYLLKALEVDAFDSRLTAIEQTLALPPETPHLYDTNSSTTTH